MTTRSSPEVDVQFACEASGLPSAKRITFWVTRTIEQSGKSLGSITELSVRLVDKDEMQSLNRDYRGMDKVTNVLSFPAGDVAGLPKGAGRALGDIVICAAVVADEAEQLGKSASDHWAHLLVHGTLHLLGFDHENDEQAVEMERLETHILGSAGLADPYAIR